MNVREVDTISPDDLTASAAFTIPTSVFNPHGAKLFGVEHMTRDPENGLHYAEAVDLLDYYGNPHPVYSTVYVKGFSAGGLYCWFLAWDGERWHTKMAFSIRGTFKFYSQQYTLTKRKD